MKCDKKTSINIVTSLYVAYFDAKFKNDCKDADKQVKKTFKYLNEAEKNLKEYSNQKTGKILLLRELKK